MALNMLSHPHTATTISLDGIKHVQSTCIATNLQPWWPCSSGWRTPGTWSASVYRWRHATPSKRPGERCSLGCSWWFPSDLYRKQRHNKVVNVCLFLWVCLFVCLFEILRLFKNMFACRTYCVSQLHYPHGRLYRMVTGTGFTFSCQ